MDVNQVAAAFEGNPFLARYADMVRAAGMTGADLVELTDPTNAADAFEISAFMSRKVASAIKDMLGTSASLMPTAASPAPAQPAVQQAQISAPTAEAPSQRSEVFELPPGKKYATFASHKKTHTKFGDSPEVIHRMRWSIFVSLHIYIVHVASCLRDLCFFRIWLMTARLLCV